MTARVSWSTDEERRAAVDELAERAGTTRSAMLDRLVDYALGTQSDLLTLSAEIDQARTEIIDYGRPIDMAGGLLGRVREDFEDRFKGSYSPKWLAAKAESYRREARMLEEKASEHPDAPHVEDGELVSHVERVLAEALEAADLTNWFQNENPFKKFTGVDDGAEERRIYIRQVEQGIRVKQQIADSFTGRFGTRDIRAADLPKQAERFLPEGVTREDVADAANLFYEQDVGVDDIEAHLRGLDPTVWDPAEERGGTDVEEQPDDEQPGDDDPEPETVPEDAVIVRGGQLVDDDPEEPDDEHTEADADDSMNPNPTPTPTDDAAAPSTTLERDDLVDEAVEMFEKYNTVDDGIERMVTSSFCPGNASDPELVDAVAALDVDVGAVVSEARERVEAAASAPTPPGAAATDGGVADE